MKRDEMTIRELYDTGKTIAGTYLEAYTYPWEVLPHIGDIVRELGSGLSEDEYQRLGEDVWIHKTVTVPPTATVKGPARNKARGLCQGKRAGGRGSSGGQFHGA